MQAILKITHQRIMLRTIIMMLGKKSTMLGNYLTTLQLILQWVQSILVPSLYWQIEMNGLVLAPDYLFGTTKIRGMDWEVWSSILLWTQKNSTDFSSLTVHEMFFHLNIASIQYEICTTKSIDITTMMLDNSSEHNQIIESERNMLSDAYHNSIVQVLTASGI